jgi:fatty-acyl-CoA synthase
MQGLMQDWPLTLDKVLDFAALTHSKRAVVSRSPHGEIVRTDYGAVHSQAHRVSRALIESGICLGDRIGTLAWNTAEHLALWYGIYGIGAIVHTLNPRLLPDQIAWIINHAGDRLLFVDAGFLPIVRAIAPKLETVEAIVVLSASGDGPWDGVPNAKSLDAFLAGHDAPVKWGSFPESTAAGLCYTSGTTGNPKGVLYSHRSNILHALAANQGDGFGLCARDVVLMIVPMFHANAWALTSVCPMAGASLILPGSKLDGASVFELLETERVTLTAAVPTVWLSLLQYLKETKQRPSTLQRVIIGGSAVPEAILRAFEEDYGVRVIHAWGMTEMSPMGSLCTLGPEEEKLDHDSQIRLKLKQGRAPFLVEMKIVDDAGRELPRDGKAFGRLQVRGPAVTRAYFRGDGARRPDGSALEEDGFFDTGDVATIDPAGYMQITDRAKDVIKSGGEWISSIEIENIAVGAAGVANAAVIGVAHPKWDERPLLIIEPLEPGGVAKEAVLRFLEGKIAKWWMPDDVAFVEKIPLGATGKINKLLLRQQFEHYRLPTA